MEPDIQRNEMLLAPTMAFKKVQMADKYPKGQSRGRQWKHLRFLLQAADATSLPPDRPNCERLYILPAVELLSCLRFDLQIKWSCRF
jgi:INO80 complex subunit C